MYTYKNIGIFKVISPVRSYLPLSTNIPDIQLEPGSLHAFNVETLWKRKYYGNFIHSSLHELGYTVDCSAT